MMVLLLLLCFIDGTLVMSSKPNTLVGNVAKRLTGGDQYTHAAIVLDNQVYELDWPRARRTPATTYGRPKAIYHYYSPVVPYAPSQVAAMRSSLNSRLGQRYQLRNYLRPGSRATSGSWCSPFVAETLNASGRYRINASVGREPQSLLQSVQNDYRRIK